MHTMFSTNVTGLINMTQAILPIFLSRPDGGRGDIINIGSIAGREPYAGGSIYCATKAAVRSFTDSLRKELIASRVRIIEVDPGQVETEFSVVRFYGDKEKAKKVYEGVEPLTPEDIAEVVVFAATRRENVVIADTLVFPSHQVRSFSPSHFTPLECSANIRSQGWCWCHAQKVIDHTRTSCRNHVKVQQIQNNLLLISITRYPSLATHRIHRHHTREMSERFSCARPIRPPEEGLLVHKNTGPHAFYRRVVFDIPTLR